MKLHSRFKLTSLELASLSLLAVGVILTVIILMIRSCNSSTHSVVINTTTDSIISKIDNAPAIPRDTAITKKRRQTKTKTKQTTPRSHSVSRHHLDEIVNE